MYNWKTNITTRSTTWERSMNVDDFLLGMFGKSELVESRAGRETEAFLRKAPLCSSRVQEDCPNYGRSCSNKGQI